MRRFLRKSVEAVTKARRSLFSAGAAVSSRFLERADPSRLSQDEIAQARISHDSWELNKPLIKAAREGDIGGIRAALADGCDDIDGALYAAACGYINNGNHILVVSYLFDLGARILCENSQKGLIQHAAFCGKIEIIHFFEEKGFSFKKSDWALAFAVEQGQSDIIDFLIKKVRTPFHNQTLFNAALYNRFQYMPEILEKSFSPDCEGYAPSHWQVKKMRTPLWAAVTRGHVEAAKLLLEAGANPKLLEPRDVLEGVEILPGFDNGGLPMGRLLLEHAGSAPWKSELAEVVARLEARAEAENSSGKPGS